MARAGVTGRGRLLDLACGPGRVTFALAGHFGEVLAVDLEEEAIGYAGRVAVERGAAHVTWRAGRAEELDVGGPFELITVGDAFHRLDRRRVAALATGWLQPGGHIALLWSSMPWGGPAAWQRAAMEVVTDWMEATGSIANIPPDLADSVAREPHEAVLAAAGLTVAGRFEFVVPHTWTIEALAGFAHSTSILSRAVLGGQVEAFEHDLRDRLLAVRPDGRFDETVSFTYDLAVNDPAGTGR